MGRDPVARLGIIGASGFVGRAVLRALARIAPGIEAVALDRPDFDLTKPATWAGLTQHFDCVLHAAGRSDGPGQEIFDVNARNIGALAERCAAADVRKFVYLSTGAVYGACAEPTTPDTPQKPNGDYALSKWLAEKKLQETFRGILHILRLYFPYGRGQKPPRLVPMLCDRIARGEPIRCNPDGGPRINLAHVDDLAQAIVEDFILGPGAGPVTNLASDQVVGIEALVTALAARMNRPLTLVRDGAQLDTLSVPYRPGRWRPFDAAEAI